MQSENFVRVSKKLWFMDLMAVFLLTILAACSHIDESSMPTGVVIDTPFVPAILPYPTTGNIFRDGPTFAPTPSLSPTPVYNIMLSATLAPGQYLGSLSDCESSQSCWIDIFDMDGVAVQNPIKMPFDGTGASSFVYQDGKIAFYVSHSDENSNSFPGNIRVMNILSGEIFEISIPDDLDCWPVDWSPDETYLLVSCQRQDGTTILASSKISNGEFTILLDAQKDVSSQYVYDFPKWSVDGKQILFYKVIPCGGCEHSDDDLYSLNLSCLSGPNTCQSQVSALNLSVRDEQANEDDEYNYIGTRAWMPNGNIAVVVRDQIREYSPFTGQQIRSFPLESSDFGVETIAGSPDGQWMLVTPFFSDSYLVSVQGGDWIDLGIHLGNPFWITIK